MDHQEFRVFLVRLVGKVQQALLDFKDRLEELVQQGLQEQLVKLDSLEHQVHSVNQVSLDNQV